MKTQILAAALTLGLIAGGTAALADTAQSTPATQTAQSTTTPCVPAQDPAIPLAIWMRTTQIEPLVPSILYMASMRGACVGTKQYVPASQSTQSAYPYPGAFYVFGPYPFTQYRGN